jgi:ATF/CREB family transcription factor
MTQDNDTMQNQIFQLKEEILTMKSFLLSHKDCPIALLNGLDVHGIEATLNASTILN